MASNYPTSLDNFTNPTSNDSLNSPSHSLQHANINDAVEAIEAKLGIGASTAGSAVSGYVLTAGTGGTTTWQAIAPAGMVLITSQSFSTATSVIVDSVFSSSYRNYKMFLDLTAVSASDTNLSYYFRSGSPASDTTTEYYRHQFAGYSSTYSSVEQANSIFASPSSSYSDLCGVEMVIYKPNLATNTTTSNQSSFIVSSGARYSAIYSIWQLSSTQFTGMKILSSSGTISGRISIYGLDD